MALHYAPAVLPVVAGSCLAVAPLALPSDPGCSCQVPESRVALVAVGALQEWSCLAWEHGGDMCRWCLHSGRASPLPLPHLQHTAGQSRPAQCMSSVSVRSRIRSHVLYVLLLLRGPYLLAKDWQPPHVSMAAA